MAFWHQSSATMKLLLVRHPVPDVDTGICYGRLDLPLRSDAGPAILEIAEGVRRHGIAVVWSSPAIRCLVPAQAAAAAAQARLRVDDRLLELDFGRWEGVRWTDIERSEFDRWAADPSGFAPPGGETGLALLTRAGDLLQALIAEDVDCAVISHGGPLRILRALACGATPNLLAPPPRFGAMITINR
jgi:alpha-ribazole phosphatase